MAAVNMTVRRRDVTRSSELLRRHPDRAEWAVHALAQIPDDVTAQLPIEGRERGRIELLARAYGVSERLGFRASARLQQPLEQLIDGKVTFAEAVEALVENSDDVPCIRGDDSVFRGQRIAVMTNLPAHYRVPLFSVIAARLEAAGARFVVFFCGRGAPSRSWLASSEPLAFEHQFLKTVSIPVRHRPPLMPLALEPALRRLRPTLALSAGFSPAISGRVARYARRSGIGFGVWSGEHEHMPTAHTRLRVAQRRRLLSRTDFAVAYGSASTRYLRTLAPALPTLIGRNTSPLPHAAKGESRKPVHIIAIGDLADGRKGIDVIVAALRASPDLHCRLTVVGGGGNLAALSAQAQGDERINLVGARRATETRRLLSSANVFVFPTRSDVFGLTLVEAMGAGLPTLVSPAAGAVHDLCVNRRNCIVIPSHEPRRWAEAIAEIVADQPLRQSLGARARRTIVSRWTLEHAADAMVAGLRLGVVNGAAV